MSDTQPTELTPEAQAVMARARRTFMVTMGLLILGFIAVAFALVYRTAGFGVSSTTEYVIAALKIPSGAEVVSAVAADGKVSLTYKNGTVTSVRIFDGRTGEMIREIPVVAD